MTKAKAKAKRAVETLVNAAYQRHFNCVSVNMMDLSKIMDVGRKALAAGENLDEAMIGAVAVFRKDK